MLDMFDDLVGASTRIHGSKERSWRRLVDKLNLIDLNLIVAHKKGSIFTKQAVSGRLDQSKLDCCYASNKGG